MAPPLFHQLKRSKSTQLVTTLLCSLIIGITDYLTGTEVNLSLFYLLPVCFITWFAGRKEGLLLAVLSAILWVLSDFLLVRSSYLYSAITYWNAATRAALFTIVVFLLSSLKTGLEREKEFSRLKTDMLSLIGHSNLALGSSLELHGVGKSILEAVEVFFPGCAIIIRLFNRETKTFEPLASCNLDEQEWTRESPYLAVGRDFEDMKAPLIIRNVQTDSRGWNTDFCRRNGLVSFLRLPLLAQGDLLGILSFYTRHEHEFTKEEAAFFSALTGQAAMVLHNVRLFEKIRASEAQLGRLSRRLLEVQESDRQHIARELHDEIGQTLTGIKRTLEAISRLPLQEASAKLAEAQALLDELISRTRALSLDLRPLMLEHTGLLPTLLWYFERYTSSTQVKVTVDQSDLEGKRFAPLLELVAYRIVQEALTNVARHAGVDHVTVHIRPERDTLIIEIEDAGVGFDAQAVMRAANTSGLAGMRERAILVGGKLEIEAIPGRGTRIAAEFPFEPAEKEKEAWIK